MEIEKTFISEKEEDREIKSEKVEEICNKIKKQENIDLKITENNTSEAIKEIEGLPQYQEYLDQKVTMDTFDEIINELREKSEEINDEDLEYITDFLQEQVDELNKNVREYYNVVMETSRGSKAVRFSDPDKLKRWAESKDKKRRHCHDLIVTELGIFKRMIKEKLPEDFNINLNNDFFDEEDLPAGLLENINDYNSLSGEEKDSRRKIGEWAFKTGRGEKLITYLEDLKK